MRILSGTEPMGLAREMTPSAGCLSGSATL